MGTFYATLHIVGMTLAVGPLVWAPWRGWRATGRRDAPATRAAARTLLVTGAVSLIAAGFGAAAAGDRLSRPWLLISATLYVVVLLVAIGYAAPALNRAARMINSRRAQQSVPEPRTAPVPGPGTVLEEPTKPEPSGVDQEALMRADIQANLRLDVLAGRVAGAGLIMLVGVVAIVSLMVVKPFGA